MMPASLKMESDMTMSVKDRLNEDFVRCSKCDCTYFEEFEVQRVNKFTTTVVGQKTAKVGPGPFLLLRCAKCSTIHEPNITYAATIGLNKGYVAFREELDKKVDEPSK